VFDNTASGAAAADALVLSSLLAASGREDAQDQALAGADVHEP